MDFHTSTRSWMEYLEWKTVTCSPKRCCKRCTIWAVKEISGSKKSTCLSCANCSSIKEKYTSVFPEEVTPSNKTTGVVFQAVLMPSKAACCAGESAGRATAFRWSKRGRSSCTKRSSNTPLSKRVRKRAAGEFKRFFSWLIFTHSCSSSCSWRRAKITSLCLGARLSCSNNWFKAASSWWSGWIRK